MDGFDLRELSILLKDQLEAGLEILHVVNTLDVNKMEARQYLWLDPGSNKKPPQTIAYLQHQLAHTLERD